MVNSKDKGSAFEREITKKLNKLVKSGEFKKVPGSGMLGTKLEMPTLGGDLFGSVDGMERTLRGEAKVGYGGSKTFSMKKEWLDKIHDEAFRTMSLPFLVGRFSGARSGVEEFVVLDINEFAYLLNHITELYEELNRVYGKLDVLNR